jgi:hypothetical protein
MGCEYCLSGGSQHFGGASYEPTEPGWGTLIKHGSFKGSRAWTILSDMQSNFDEQQANLSCLFYVREYVSVLLMRARPVSILSGFRQYDHRKEDGWSSGKEGTLVWCTFDFRKVELLVSTDTIASVNDILLSSKTTS